MAFLHPYQDTTSQSLYINIPFFVAGKKCTYSNGLLREQERSIIYIHILKYTISQIRVLPGVYMFVLGYIYRTQFVMFGLRKPRKLANTEYVAHFSYFSAL